MDKHHFYTREEILKNRPKLREAYLKAKAAKNDEKNKSSQSRSENSQETEREAYESVEDHGIAPKKRKLSHDITSETTVHAMDMALQAEIIRHSENVTNVTTNITSETTVHAMDMALQSVIVTQNEDVAIVIEHNTSSDVMTVSEGNSSNDFEKNVGEIELSTNNKAGEEILDQDDKIRENVGDGASQDKMVVGDKNEKMGDKIKVTSNVMPGEEMFAEDNKILNNVEDDTSSDVMTVSEGNSSNDFETSTSENQYETNANKIKVTLNEMTGELTTRDDNIRNNVVDDTSADILTDSTSSTQREAKGSDISNKAKIQYAVTEEDSLGHKSTPSTTQLEIEQSPKTDEQEEKIQNNESDTPSVMGFQETFVQTLPKVIRNKIVVEQNNEAAEYGHEEYYQEVNELPFMGIVLGDDNTAGISLDEIIQLGSQIPTSSPNSPSIPNISKVPFNDDAQATSNELEKEKVVRKLKGHPLSYYKNLKFARNITSNKKRTSSNINVAKDQYHVKQDLLKSKIYKIALENFQNPGFKLNTNDRIELGMSDQQIQYMMDDYYEQLTEDDYEFRVHEDAVDKKGNLTRMPDILEIRCKGCNEFNCYKHAINVRECKSLPCEFNRCPINVDGHFCGEKLYSLDHVKDHYNDKHVIDHNFKGGNFKDAIVGVIRRERYKDLSNATFINFCFYINYNSKAVKARPEKGEQKNLKTYDPSIEKETKKDIKTTKKQKQKAKMEETQVVDDDSDDSDEIDPTVTFNIPNVREKAKLNLQKLVQKK